MRRRPSQKVGVASAIALVDADEARQGIPRPDRRQHADWSPNEKHDEHAAQCQLDRRGNALANQVGNRTIRDVRHPQIAPCRVTDPGQVLRHERDDPSQSDGATPRSARWSRSVRREPTRGRRESGG